MSKKLLQSFNHFLFEKSDAGFENVSLQRKVSIFYINITSDVALLSICSKRDLFSHGSGSEGPPTLSMTHHPQRHDSSPAQRLLDPIHKSMSFWKVKHIRTLFCVRKNKEGAVQDQTGLVTSSEGWCHCTAITLPPNVRLGEKVIKDH